MLFNSYIFVLLFLPIVCIINCILVKYNKNEILKLFLIIASFLFYLYAGIESLVILLINLFINYLFYVSLKRGKTEKYKKIFLISGIGFNLITLFYFKYFNFFVDNVNLFLQQDISIREIVQPLGISFIIFQQMAFLVDVSKGKVDKCSLLDYLVFITFFPHISSGPILLHNDLIPSLQEEKIVDWNKIGAGIYQFVMGLGKKVLIADRFAEAVNWGYANVESLNSNSAILVSILYSLQIYFDFSGYSDMAIGISKMLQLDLPVNFNSPYKSKTILEFWDRWHMTLTRFFTRYLYIPLGGSRKGKVRTYINTMIVFGISGLWHGASYTFILWGILHGGFMVITKMFINFFQRIPDWLNQVITLVFVNLTWIVFRAGSLSTLKSMLHNILKLKWGNFEAGLCEPFYPVLMKYDESNFATWIWPIAAVLLMGYVVLKCKNVEEKIEEFQFSTWNCMIVVVVVVLSILSFGGVNTFIYSNF